MMGNRAIGTDFIASIVSHTLLYFRMNARSGVFCNGINEL